MYYYIGPQVWAWKAKRRFKMAKIIDQLGVIFPFEVDCFADTCLPTAFVGHPFTRSDYQLPFYYEATAPILLLPGVEWVLFVVFFRIFWRPLSMLGESVRRSQLVSFIPVSRFCSIYAKCCPLFRIWSQSFLFVPILNWVCRPVES